MEYAFSLQAWLSDLCLWLAETILALGYPGLAVLMAVESSLIPFPSEVVMPPAGYLIHEGKMSWLPAILSGTAGSLAGALFNYWLALRLGRPFLLRHGKYVFLNSGGLERAERFFASHGEIATLVGRLIPVVRQLISLPAGAAGMRLDRFCLFTALGSALWISALTLVGWLVGRNRELLGVYMRQATLWALAGAVALVFLYIRFRRRDSGN
ncbi:MAG: DedA family protein [Planctomycetota bacterium]|jgi:membrane protein DedA with SNARE-associated domain|nr:DedA family protein [Planctomycetota bacterium]